MYWKSVMIIHYPYHQLGKANHGWLNARHHFSFAHYYNPSRMEFGKLRVVNDDTVAPKKGFAPHSHRNMEIISFVRTGEITHEDSLGNKGVTRAGEVQVMSAGSGIVHSEYNLTNQPLKFFQIWIEPNKTNVKPRWQSKPFPKSIVKDKLALLVSGDKRDKNALFIHQDAKIYGGVLAQHSQISHTIANQAYVILSAGKVTLTSEDGEQITMEEGDGAELTYINSMTITSQLDSEILIIDVSQ